MVVFLNTLVKNVRATAVALKSANLCRVLPVFSALRCVAPIFSALKASIPSKNVHETAVALKSANLRRLLPFFSAEKINFFSLGQFYLEGPSFSLN